MRFLVARVRGDVYVMERRHVGVEGRAEVEVYEPIATAVNVAEAERMVEALNKHPAPLD